ncbi:MAG: Crp/Fnr family transcriptional regulator [Candidatus Promineifilaceae bacterium]
MLTPTARQSITRCALLHNLSETECQAVIEQGRLTQVKADDYFFHQGDDATIMYILIEGQAKLSQINEEGQQVIINYFGPGNGLGIIVALSYMPYPLSAVAVVDCQAICWHRDVMRALMLRYPTLAMNGMEMVGKRFAWLQDRYQEVATKQVEQRLARAVLRLVRQFGKRIETGVLIDIPLSRQDLAEMTGTNLYNVSRILSKWEQEGLVQNGRKQVTLCKAHELVMIAEDLHRKFPEQADK